MKFNEAVYEGLRLPGVAKTWRITLPGPATGVLDDGVTRTTLDLDTLTLDWRGSGYVHLESTKPVQIRRGSPYLLLRGQAGLTGDFAKQDDRSLLRFPAPVHAWLNRKSGKAFLSLTAETGDPDAAAGYLCIQCERKQGGLILDYAKHQIVFDQRVVVSPIAEPEIPASPSPRRFECHRLVVQIDPETRELAWAETERGTDAPVRGYWDTVTVQCGKARWHATDDTAELTQSPQMWGKTEQFRFDATAQHITFDSAAGRAKLAGPINGHIERKPPESPKEFDLPSYWQLSADLGEVFFTRTGKHRITEIRALMDPTLPSPKGVTFEHRVDGSIFARGGELSYKVDDEIMTVTGFEGNPPVLLIEREGQDLFPSGAADLRSINLKAYATTVSFSFDEGCILLEENVQTTVLRTTTSGEELTDKLNAHRVTIAGRSASSKALRVEAWAKDPAQPLSLDYGGPPICRLEGGHLIWDGAQRGAKILPYEGIDTQQISFHGRRLASLRSRELEFTPRDALATAAGDVAVTIETDHGDVGITADRATVTIDPDRTQEGAEPRLSSVRKVVATAEPGNRVTLRSNKAEGTAGEITYDATNPARPTVVLAGQGRQVFRFLGPAGPDELSAQSVKFWPAENRLLLSGGVAGTLHQKNYRDPQGTSPVPGLPADQEAPSTPWSYRADSAQAQFTRAGDKLELTSLVATGNLRLENKELKILITGERLTFNPLARTIDLDAPPEVAALQTLRFGAPPQASLLNAQSIRVSRREELVDGRAEARIVAKLSGDVNCTFHLRALPTVKDVPSYAPEKFNVTADTVSFIVPAGKTLTPGLVSFARADGNVAFKAWNQSSGPATKPPYSGSGATAVYKSAPFNFALLGDRAGGDATVETPTGPYRAEAIILLRRTNGTFSVMSGPASKFKLADTLRNNKP
jgi:lipopolysaccharide export system protein LptA